MLSLLMGCKRNALMDYCTSGSQHRLHNYLRILIRQKNSNDLSMVSKYLNICGVFLLFYVHYYQIPNKAKVILAKCTLLSPERI